MKITILTSGTRGDTQPYIALGMELKKAGHAVQIAAFQNYESFVKLYGLEFYPIKGDVAIITASESGTEAMQADNPLKFLLSFNKLKSFLFDVQKDFLEACRDSDIIVYHPGAAIGYFAAQHFHVPSVLASPFPMSPTGEYPALIFYNNPRLGKGFNHLTHRVFEQIMWFASSAPLKEFWIKEFGKLPENFSSPFSKQSTKELPTIISCSNFVFPTPSDWPEGIHNTGYWFLDDEQDWQPPSELLDFIKKGTKPIYVGFGSIGDPKTVMQTTNLIIEALQRSTQRGILATGWSGLAKPEHIPENIFIIEGAPHSWLFPKMAAVIHHGGAATTAAGLRAGIPTIIIPHGNDQFAWGRRVFELGVGAKPIPRKTLTAERLSEAIQFALSEKVVNAAHELGYKIQGERGAENAARIISQVPGFHP
jgi:sterol 3beta-glucosyltransferase